MLKQLDRIRLQKEKVLPKQVPGAKPKDPPPNRDNGAHGSTTPAMSSSNGSAVLVEDDERPSLPNPGASQPDAMSITPPNKRHQTVPAEEQEYAQRIQQGS